MTPAPDHRFHRPKSTNHADLNDPHSCREAHGPAAVAYSLIAMAAPLRISAVNATARPAGSMRGR